MLHNLGCLLLLIHNLDLVPVDGSPTVRRAYVKIVRPCSSVANPETQKAYENHKDYRQWMTI